MRIHIEFVDASGALDIYAPIAVDETGVDPNTGVPMGLARLSRAVFPVDLGTIREVTFTDLSKPAFPVKWKSERASESGDGAWVVFELEMTA